MASSDHRDLARTRLGAITRSSAMPAEPPWTDDRSANDHPWADPDDGDEPLHSGPGRERFVDRLTAARWDTGRRGTAALAAIGVLAAAVALVVVWRDRPVPEPVPPLPRVEVVDTAEPSAARETDTAQPDSADFVVSVVGAVIRPGLVRLPAGSRVADALDAAGGAVDGADLIGLNLARRVADGDQIVVGIAPPQPVPQASGIVGAQTPGDAPPEAGGPVDLNTADETALDALPGVGPVTAAAIVSWRDTNGPFTDVEQLGEVDGIGPARLARLRELVTV
ncbi:MULTISPECIES: ComEA family DNA-binding protein [Rhodococcus]|uniref:Competence protein comea n=2 Tax=Rhodococcus TaxID=1827 RepID=H0JXY5_9NOCA|nr:MULTISPECIES: ComEA family DNA-binding protein [Rhodococcus]EHK80819.1 competence protein comea [Rhodococcus pyridinivorans AK37]MBX4168551.1 ComEA family DNA-binding protein [Rhodococcus sp. DMU2021]MCD2139360.1 ComEA family DNA-binding protein [Rhodococcus pyridinivorans]MCW3470175.1 ComEA family DNA-binding protein [Rhodococcus pyridinivorans]QQM51761.1 ComEA family DNA-binding protein [Rhodococcus pyridinivorans]